MRRANAILSEIALITGWRKLYNIAKLWKHCNTKLSLALMLDLTNHMIDLYLLKIGETFLELYKKDRSIEEKHDYLNLISALIVHAVGGTCSTFYLKYFRNLFVPLRAVIMSILCEGVEY